MTIVQRVDFFSLLVAAHLEIVLHWKNTHLLIIKFLGNHIWWAALAEKLTSKFQSAEGQAKADEFFNTTSFLIICECLDNSFSQPEHVAMERYSELDLVSHLLPSLGAIVICLLL